jgi:hypothetical protein
MDFNKYFENKKRQLYINYLIEKFEKFIINSNK